jgi:hypothetical protein
MDADSVELLFSFGHLTFAEQFQNDYPKHHEFYADSDSILVLSLLSASNISEGASSLELTLFHVNMLLISWRLVSNCVT